MTRWFANYWKAYLARGGRREDAILALQAVAMARFGQGLYFDILLLVIVALMTMRLMADWDK